MITENNRKFFQMMLAVPVVGWISFTPMLVLSVPRDLSATNTPAPWHRQATQTSDPLSLEWLMTEAATGSRTEACRRSGICY